jgi:hypothetical protein
MDFSATGNLMAGGYTFPTLVKARASATTGRVLSYGIFVGGFVHGRDPKDRCVEIMVDPPPDNAAADGMPCYYEPRHRVAKLQAVRYSPCCASGADLHKPGGTALILRAACAYVLGEFSWVEGFELDDTSYVVCGSDDDGEPGAATAALAAVGILTRGSTWYEREFGAVLATAGAHAEYRLRVSDKLQSAAAKPDTIDCMFAKAGLTAGDAWGGSPDVLAAVSRCYASAETVQAFFMAVKEWCGRRVDGDTCFCRLIAPWAHTIVDGLIGDLHHGRWVIPGSTVASAAPQVTAGWWCDCRVCREGCIAMGTRAHVGEAFSHPVDDIS